MFRNLLNKLKVVNIYLQFFLRNMKNIKLNPTLAYDVFYTIFNIYLWFKVKFSPIFYWNTLTDGRDVIQQNKNISFNSYISDIPGCNQLQDWLCLIFDILKNMFNTRVSIFFSVIC